MVSEYDPAAIPCPIGSINVRRQLQMVKWYGEFAASQHPLDRVLS